MRHFVTPGGIAERRDRALVSIHVRFRPHTLLAGLLLIVPCLAASAPPAREVIEAARQLIHDRRLPEARTPLEELMAREPQNVDAALLLAWVYDGLGRRDEAIDMLGPLVDKNPSDARLLGVYAGQCMLRAGELGAGFRALRLARKGRDLMERAVALDPGNVAYREGLVDFYRQAPAIAGGGLALARAHADALARLDPVRGAAWQASILVEEKKFPEALAACDAALAARPDDYAALFNFGRTVAESGLRLDEGERALRSLLGRAPRPGEPSHAGVWFRLGLIAERRGDREAALAAHREALRLEPNFNRPAEALRRLESARG